MKWMNHRSQIVTQLLLLQLLRVEMVAEKSLCMIPKIATMRRMHSSVDRHRGVPQRGSEILCARHARSTFPIIPNQTSSDLNNNNNIPSPVLVLRQAVSLHPLPIPRMKHCHWTG